MPHLAISGNVAEAVLHEETVPPRAEAKLQNATRMCTGDEANVGGQMVECARHGYNLSIVLCLYNRVRGKKRKIERDKIDRDRERKSDKEEGRKQGEVGTSLSPFFSPSLFC